MEFDFTVLAIIAGLFQPFVTALGTKVDAGDLTKGLVSVTFAAVVAVLQPVFGDGELPVSWEAFGTDFISVYSVGLMSWLGLTSDWTRQLNEVTAKVGLPTLPVPGTGPVD